MQHVPGRFCHHLCEKSGKKEGKSRDRPRGKSGEERAIKREGTRGQDAQCVCERLKVSGVGCETALSVGFCTFSRNFGLCPLNMPLVGLLQLLFCL